MSMTEHTDFATEYRGMTDEQLLEVAGEGELVDEAQQALQVEMQNRKLTRQMADTYHAGQMRFKNAGKIKDPNNSTFAGIGFRTFGRACLSEGDRANGIEVRTKWFVLRDLPIFPVASYRYSRKEMTTGQISWTEEKLIDRVPLDWKQAIRTWSVGIGFIVLTITLVALFVAWQDRAHR
jgi:hypothetical protein